MMSISVEATTARDSLSDDRELVYTNAKHLHNGTHNLQTG
ncbi:hypothetical protein LINGRAHAP2_LOCUS44 [Linum grandiflorum]